MISLFYISVFEGISALVEIPGNCVAAAVGRELSEYIDIYTCLHSYMHACVQVHQKDKRGFVSEMSASALALAFWCCWKSYRVNHFQSVRSGAGGGRSLAKAGAQWYS